MSKGKKREKEQILTFDLNIIPSHFRYFHIDHGYSTNSINNYRFALKY